MPWNPDVYNTFKEERHQPFYDLIAHLHARPAMRIIDLGCGTGELTNIIAEKFAPARLVGIDSSAEMLQQAPQTAHISFSQIAIEEQLQLDEKWDVIVANASLQWVDNHPALFAQIISRLQPHGQLAVQMPSQKENLLNQLLYTLVHEPPYYEALKDVIHHSPVLSLDQYTSLLFANGAKEVLVYQKVYPIIAQSTDRFYNFISGSALTPYITRLEGTMKTDFENTYRKRISDHFTSAPMVYAFKRIFLVAGF